MESITKVVEVKLSSEEALAIANDLVQLNVLCDTSEELINTLGVEKPEVVEEETVVEEQSEDNPSF